MGGVFSSVNLLAKLIKRAAFAALFISTPLPHFGTEVRLIT